MDGLGVGVGLGGVFIGLLFWLFVEAFSDPSNGDTAWDAIFIAIIMAPGGGLLLAFLTWCIFTFRRGQTPGKMIVGIQDVDATTGETLGWGRTFLRELVVKGSIWWICLPVIAVDAFLDGEIDSPALWWPLLVLWIVNCLWPLWDKDNRALHDRIVRTTVAMAAPRT